MKEEVNKELPYDAANEIRTRVNLSWTIEENIAYWHDNETGNELREFLGVEESTYGLWLRQRITDQGLLMIMKANHPQNKRKNDKGDVKAMEEKNQELTQEQFEKRKGRINEILNGFLLKRKEEKSEKPEELKKQFAFTATEEEQKQLAEFGKTRSELRHLLRVVATEIYDLDQKRADWWEKFTKDHEFTYDTDKYYLQFDYDKTLDVILIRKDEQ
jgi:hypothetical protein